MRTNYSLDIVVPCFNEQEALPKTVTTLFEYLNTMRSLSTISVAKIRILLVDDGSTDETWPIIQSLAIGHQEVVGLKLSRNYGHQLAMLSGLSHATADTVLTMDADLQDELGAIERMLVAYQSGADLALGVRIDRSSDRRRKRWTANSYYWLLDKLGVGIIPNHADYRLMSRRALDALLLHSEVNLFIRGLIPALGFSVTLIPYVRKERVAGETKYTLRKMLRLAVDGVTSFSVVPLRMTAVLGAIVCLMTFITGAHFLIVSLFGAHHTVPGWASTVLPMLFLGGFQLLSIGVLGEYVGKIYMEVKRRPRFIVSEMTE